MSRRVDDLFDIAVTVDLDRASRRVRRQYERTLEDFKRAKPTTDPREEVMVSFMFRNGYTPAELSKLGFRWPSKPGSMDLLRGLVSDRLLEVDEKGKYWMTDRGLAYMTQGTVGES